MKSIGIIRPVATQDGDILQPGGTVYNPTQVYTPVVPKPPVTPIVEPITPPVTPQGTQGPFKDTSGNPYWIVNGVKTYYNPNPTPITVTPVPVTPLPPVKPPVVDPVTTTPVAPIPTPTPVTVTPVLPITPITTPQPTTDMQPLTNTGTQGPYKDASGAQYWIVNGLKTY